MKDISNEITREDRDYIRSRDPIAGMVLESMIKTGEIKIVEVGTRPRIQILK